MFFSDNMMTKFQWDDKNFIDLAFYKYRNVASDDQIQDLFIVELFIS